MNFRLTTKNKTTTLIKRAEWHFGQNATLARVIWPEWFGQSDLARVSLWPETLWSERQFGQCHYGWWHFGGQWHFGQSDTLARDTLARMPLWPEWHFGQNDTLASFLLPLGDQKVKKMSLWPKCNSANKENRISDLFL